MTGLDCRIHWLGLLLIVSSAAFASEPASRTLASFDIGSGTTRMLVAEVANCSGDILHVYESARARVSYADDLARSVDGRFSADLLGEANAVMAELIARVDTHRPERKLAVATQAFRQAGNADTLLEHWRVQHDLSVRVLDQEEEARLAWRLVSARLGEPSGLMVWDIGAGSQQIVWREPENAGWQYLNSDLASVTFRDRAVEILERPVGLISPNPLSREETERLAAAIRSWIDPARSSAVAEQVAAGAQVVGIGGVHGASLLNQLELMAGDIVERSDIADQLERQLDRSDEEIGGSYADTEVVNLILVGTLMDVYGISQYRALPVNLTEAILLDHTQGCGP